jgi:DNA mismatch repair protein MutS2
MLVVTGPNTGGKTVALKTVGLMVLMHQFGIPLPAGERSALPLTDAVYADIGDEQSIAQSLSTFSGHMTTIASILESATGASLVLLDELGAGTDPEEGSSLAMAILDSLRERTCYSLVTTHHSALKSYAYRHDEVVNASVEFDTDTLEPTYHLLTGVPGSSHAMTIAERTGLSAEVVNAARKYLEENQSDAAQIIQKLTEEQTALREQQKEQDEQWRTLQRERENLEERKRDLDQREVRLEEGYLQDFERFQSETRKQLENLVRELREGELTKDKTQRVKSFLDGLSRTKEQEQKRVDKRKRETEREAAEAQELKAGMTVRMKGPGKRGVIQRRGKGDRWVVQMDNMTVTVPESQLEPAERPRKRGDAGYSVTITGGDGSPPSHELDVRGMRLEQARSTVERQIDQALLSGLSWFEIIHGKGEGVLQQGIRELLKTHPSVSEYSFAPTDQGGHGKTVVHLRQESS